MKCNIKLYLSALACLAVFATFGQEVQMTFVKVPETRFYIKQNGKIDSVHLDAFEICNRPVTNREYQKFTSATGHTKPSHWVGGAIPQGMEDYPLIFVNRFDVDDYLMWLNKVDPKNYRMPYTTESELVTWGKQKGKTYVVDRNDRADLKNINYDATSSRPFDQWRNYLRPAVYGPENDWGLYGMLGNVWQLHNDFPDPDINKYKFRIIEGPSLERNILGGSWARSKEYLSPGAVMQQSPGIWLPDIGFRLVRQPLHRQVNRRLCIVPSATNETSLSWAYLKSDGLVAGFNIYRFEGENRNQAGFKCNNALIKTTSYIDGKLKKGIRYQYRIVAVDKNGEALNTSEWAGFNVPEDNLPIVATFSPVHNGGSLVPVFGDILGVGKLGCVIRISNGNEEDSQDPGIPVQLEAFSAAGHSLWRKNVAHHDNVYGSASNAAFNVWDMDQDGKSEVITLLEEGDTINIAILDGTSGSVKYRVPWPKMKTDFYRSSTRMQLSIAYLDGKTPSVITQTGIYENEVIAAFDSKLKPLWVYNSFGETNGSGGHKIEVADVDGDGRQEVIYGTTCLNHDGTVRWSIYRQHPDIISIQDYLPNRKGLEVFYVVETTAHAGAYMVDANTGEVIWKNNREDDPYWSHGHTGWTADIWAGSPGIECVSNRAGHSDNKYVLFAADGKVIKYPFASIYRPFECDGDLTRELLSNNGYDVSNFNGKEFILVPGLHPNTVPNSNMIFTADLAGDFKDELVIQRKNANGRSSICVLTIPTRSDKFYVSPLESLDYRLWLGRNKGGGYSSIFGPVYSTK